MTNCVEMAKAFIAKEIIRNPRFVEALENITWQIDLLKKLPTQPAVVQRLEHYEELLETMFLTAVLDLPRNDLNKARIVKKFKSMDNREEVFNFIDSLRAWQAELPEWEIDKILDGYKLDKWDFENFIREISEANNKKIVTEYVNDKNFDVNKVIKWLSAEDLKKFKKSEDFRKEILSRYEENLDTYFRQVDKDFKDWLIDLTELNWDDLVKATEFNKKLTDKRDSLFTNYIISKYLYNEKFALENYDEFVKFIDWTLPRLWEPSIFEWTVDWTIAKQEFNQVKWIIEKKFDTKVVIDQQSFDENLWGKGREYVTSGGVVYGYEKWGQIYINPRFMKSNTLVHEAWHLWYKLASKNNKWLIDKWDWLVKEAIETDAEIAALFENIKARYKWLSDAELYEEMLTHMSEWRFLQDLKSRDESLYGKVKQFFKEMYAAIKELIWNKSLIEIDADMLTTMTIDDFIVLVNRDLLDPTFKLTSIEANNTVAWRALTNIEHNPKELSQPSLFDDIKFSIWNELSSKGKKLGFVNKWDEVIFDNRQDLKSKHSWNWAKFLDLIKEENVALHSKMKNWGFTIKKISDEYIEFEREIARWEGIILPDNTVEAERFIIASRQKSLDEWSDYFDWNSNYSEWFKNYVLKQITENVLINWMILKRTPETVTWYLPLDAATIADFYAKWWNFFKSYRELLQINAAKKANFQESIKSWDIDWKWIKYAKNSSGKELSSFVCWTPRCTSWVETAQSQLNMWDFYVFATKWKDWEYNTPRIAIRMEDWLVREVRWVENQAQKLEDSLLDIAREKYSWLDWGKNWEVKDYNARLLRSMDSKWLWWDYTIEELKVLYEIDWESSTFAYWKDQRIDEFKKWRNINADFAKIYWVKESEILAIDSPLMYSSDFRDSFLEKDVKILYFSRTDADWMRRIQTWFYQLLENLGNWTINDINSNSRSTIINKLNKIETIHWNLTIWISWRWNWFKTSSLDW